MLPRMMVGAVFAFLISVVASVTVGVDLVIAVSVGVLCGAAISAVYWWTGRGK